MTRTHDTRAAGLRPRKTSCNVVRMTTTTPLTWTRGKIAQPYGNVTVTHTTHTATLADGSTVVIKSVDDLFFLYRDGAACGYTHKLRDAKARVQDAHDALIAREATR